MMWIFLQSDPPGFDFDAATRQFASFAAVVLLEYSDIAVRISPRLQDRSYHGEIAVPLPASHDWIHIRVSNFGNMATVYLQEHEPMQHTPWQVETPQKREPDARDMRRIATLLERWDYQRNTRGDIRHWWVKTWMNRYFGLIASEDNLQKHSFSAQSRCSLASN
jgi:hypothetical protein